MKKAFLGLILLSPLVFTTNVYAQVGTIQTETHPLELQNTQKTAPTTTAKPTQTPATQTQTQLQQTETQPQVENQSNDIQNLQNRISALEKQLAKDSSDQNLPNWLGHWWQIGFWTSLLWWFLWIFVGWQWTKFKFWGFGWPWPWWFWIPVVWFIPWLIIGWQWWLVWWVWWIWIWWLFPWVFWLLWWIILFKESTIWVWHRRNPTSVTTE